MVFRHHHKRRFLSRRTLVLFLGALVLGVIAIAVAYSHYFGPADPYAQQTEFIVNEDETMPQILQALKAQGFIRSQTAFTIAYNAANKKHLESIRPGGYELSASMDVWSIARALQEPPYLVFFSFPPGWRKEQIANKLAKTFGWTDAQKAEWLNVDTNPAPSYVEGVYFPDTYLIPSDQSPAQIAARFRDRFQQEFAPYASEAAQKGLPWTEVVILASLIEREAAGKQDMPLIAGIMLNRLKTHMALQIDASLQYAVGTDKNWWPVPTSADKYVNSPFNTYKHAGLPPHAIDEPSLTAIDAVINAQTTNCIFYLHDPNGQIHCSPTYAGQVANVKKYLK